MTSIGKNHPKKGREVVQENLFPLTVIRTETVLSRMPIHNLAKRGKVDIQITKRNSHGEVDLHWDVSYNERYGQPRQLAYRLDTLVINRKIDEHARPLPKVIRLNSLYEIAGVLGLTRNTNEVKKALHQNAGAYITAKLHYKTADGTERSLEAGFTRYGVVFTGGKLPDGTKADAVYLILNDPYWEVLNTAPTRPLDYDYLTSLKPASQRFYEIVSYKIFAAIKYRHPVAKLSYSEYCAFSAQQRYHEYDRVKKQMYKIHHPHLQSGYIERVSFTPTIDEQGNADWIMQYVPGDKARAEYQFFTNKKLRARVATKQPEEISLHTHAVALVGYFYQRFHQQEVISPNNKEIEQATALITAHGIERARFIVDFSFEEAQSTNFVPKFFGGILSYAPRAAARFDQRENARRKEARQKQQERLMQAYEQYKEGEIQRMQASISPTELSDIETSIRAELEAEGTPPAMVGVGIRIRLDALLEERADILPFEEWQNQKRRSSQGQTP